MYMYLLTYMNVLVTVTVYCQLLRQHEILRRELRGYSQQSCCNVQLLALLASLLQGRRREDMIIAEEPCVHPPCRFALATVTPSSQQRVFCLLWFQLYPPLPLRHMLLLPLLLLLLLPGRQPPPRRTAATWRAPASRAAGGRLRGLWLWLHAALLRL